MPRAKTQCAITVYLTFEERAALHAFCAMQRIPVATFVRDRLPWDEIHKATNRGDESAAEPHAGNK